MLYQGGCHCGAVKFEVEAPEEIEAHECNCSMCNKLGYLHLIVAKSKFKLLCGAQDITTYTFNTGVAKHMFCKHCGIKSFYTPRSNPTGLSINVRCLNPMPENIRVKPFDGQNWEQNAHTLTHLSDEDDKGQD